MHLKAYFQFQWSRREEAPWQRLADARHYSKFFASVDYNLNKKVNAIGNFN